MKKTALVMGLILALNLVYSQDRSFNLGAEIRPRLLLDNGYSTPKLIGTKPLAYITQRTRLNVGFQHNKLAVYVSVQDIRYWGGDNVYKSSGMFGNSESISLHQGWFSFTTDKKISIKVGRQLFHYDDQRIISSRNWNDYQVTYDAVLFKLNNHHNMLDIGMTWNSESSKNMIFPDTKIKVFDFIRYEHIFHNFSISIIGLLSGNTINDSSDIIYLKGTYGLNFKFENNGLNIRSSVYYQNNLNSNGQIVSAYCFSIFAKHKLFNNKVTIGAGLDYLSGQDETKTNSKNINHRFDILYGRRHGWYGYMDYFSTIPDQGLQDYNIKAEYNITKKITFQTDYHYFMLADNGYALESHESKLNKNLGHELDFTIKWKIMEEATLHAGYSFYLMTNSLKQIKNSYNEELGFPQFAYLMITIKPVFVN